MTQKIGWKNSLVVQWLRLCVSNAEGVGLTPNWGSKIPHALWHGPKKKNVVNFLKKERAS